MRTASRVRSRSTIWRAVERPRTPLDCNSDSERETLLQIEEALRRIDSGAFGSCSSCSKPIGEQRLDAIPWARYCIDCQELEEKGLLG